MLLKFHSFPKTETIELALSNITFEIVPPVPPTDNSVEEISPNILLKIT